MPGNRDALDESRIEVVRLFQGARYGLRRKTALVGLVHHGVLDFDGFDSAVIRLLGEAFPESLARKWKTDTRLDRTRETGLRVRDLILLLLGWSREPIFEARLLSADAKAMLFAVVWEREQTLHDTLDVVLQLLKAAAAGTSPDRLQQALHDLQAEHPGKISPLSSRLSAAAYRRGHPITLRGNFVQIGWGANARRMSHTMSDATSGIAMHTARQKFAASHLLGEAGLPVPECLLAHTFDEAQIAARRLGWPVVVKPASLDGGIAVTTNICSDELLRQAYERAIDKGPDGVIVERHVQGDDHRLLVVKGQMLICTRRTPGGVHGDGLRTVAALVDAANTDPRRGDDKHRSMLIRLALDDEARQCLAEQDLTTESVPQAGRFVAVRKAANISIGGTAEDVTDRVHPDNRRLAIRAARIVDLDIAGIDFLCPDISQSWRDVGGAICEVNSQPMLRVHWLGDPARDLEGEIIDLIVGERATRIPVVAITDLAGSSSAATVLHRILAAAGRSPGSSTSRGVTIAGEYIDDRARHGHHGPAMVFNDPLTEVAVLDLPLTTMREFGHPCDAYDVVALTDTTRVDMPEKVARLLAESIRRTRSAVVMNAGDPLWPRFRKHMANTRVVLVADRLDSVALQEHLAGGGRAVVSAVHRGERYVMLAEGTQAVPVLPLAHLDLSVADVVPFAMVDALYAAAIAWDLGVAPKLIGDALSLNIPARDSVIREV